jgi:hypothetical protein
MINKESNQTKESLPDKNKPDDSAKVDVLAHVVIKDVASGKVIVDKRG